MPWETVLDELTAPRLKSLRKSWDLNPPLHQSVAAFIFGDKRPSNGAQQNRISTVEEAQRFMAATGGKVPGLGQM